MHPRFAVVVRPRQLWRGAVLALAALLVANAAPAAGLDPVTLQLRYHHQFQFAGYYAAVEQGYYRDAGLDVHIVEGRGGAQAEAEVLAGRADYGVGSSSLLLSRLAGKPFVALAVVFQHSPFVLIMRQSGATPDLRNIIGQRVMLAENAELPGQASQAAELLAYLKHEGITERQFTVLPHSYQLRDLIDGKADAMSGYLTNEPDSLDQAGFAYDVFSPRSAGIDFYGDNLFTTEAEVARHPDRVKAFRAASLRGWVYAMSHQEEMVDLIVRRYSPRAERNHLLFEAHQMVPLVQPVLVEIGYMNPERWRNIADTYASLGMLPAHASFDGFLYNAPPTQRDLAWLYQLLAAAALLIGGGLAVHFTLLARERASVKEAIRTGEQRFRTMFEVAPMGMALIDSVSGQFRDINPRYLEIAGRTLQQMKDSHWRDITHPDDIDAEQEQINLLGARQIAGYKRQNRLLRPDGAVVWVDASVTAIETAPRARPYHVSMIEDITEKKETEALIWQQANFDTLTQLPNRRMFHDRLTQDLVQCRRDGSRIAILFIDLDHFKEVNDTLGHHQGDILLVDAARRIRACVRESDTVARLGGDEFTVILSHLEEIGRVEMIAQNIIDSLLTPFALGQEQAFVSASIGITLYPDDADTVEDLLKHADQAMYAAKGAGRNRFSYFTPALQVAALNRMRLTNDLRSALKGNQFVLYFQPIVHLRTGRIHKAEALIRWMHPQRGLVSPLEFIPLAEASGLIVDIGEWVFKQSAHWIKRWRSEHHAQFQVSVNQSPLEFQREGDAYRNWLAHLRALGLPGQAIVVEITEGLLLDASSSVTDKLLQLRDAGIQVALDDFGTGYSSLSYLKKFDIDYLKIDRSFTRNLAPDSSDMALSEAIIVMAHKLDLRVIAEGVETEQQRDLLLAAGCDYGQGYLFARPMRGEDFDAMLKAEPPL